MAKDLDSGLIDQAHYGTEVAVLRKTRPAIAPVAAEKLASTVDDQLRELAQKLGYDAVALANVLKENDFDKLATVNAMKFQLDGGESSMIAVRAWLQSSPFINGSKILLVLA